MPRYFRIHRNDVGTEAYTDAYVNHLEQVNRIFREALECIINHQELVGGGLNVLSTTHHIAQKALQDAELV